MSRFTPVDHQFSLFEYNTIRPTRKIPISAKRMREANELMKAGRPNDAVPALRELLDALESFEKRLNNPKK